MARILVVDDDANIRVMVETYLTIAGHEIVTAGDGVEALVLARERQPDLILMDMGLPKLNGWQTTQRLRARPATAAIPVIALTAYAFDDDRRRAINVGCNAFIAKPIDFPVLLSTIQELLAR